MSEVQICRICLRTKAKMYDFNVYRLKEYYEEVITKMIKDEGLPRFFCYECAIMLHKFHKFREKCHNGQQRLHEILCRGEITFEAVEAIDRLQNNLQSSLGILRESTRVKTCVIKYTKKLKEQTNLHRPEIISLKEFSEMKSPKSVECDVKYDEIDAGDIKYDDDGGDGDDIVLKDLAKYNDEVKPNEEISIEKETIEKDNYEIKIIDKDSEALVNLKLTTENKDKSKANKTKLNKHTYKRKFNKSSAKTKKKKERKDISIQEKFKKNWQQKQNLDSKNWQKFSLPEEDAVKEFQARAKDPKYINSLYKCTGCLKGFSKEDMMKRHLKLRHSESNGSMECRFCRIRFKWKSLLSRHIKEHYNKYKCLRCDLTFSRETSAHHHDQFHNGVTRTCEYCNEQFTHLSTYYTHLRKHRSKHLCALCGESFVSEFGLYMHRRVKHIMDTENQDNAAAQTTYCERCDVKFETNKAYEEHLMHSTMHSASEETPTLMNLKGGIVIRRVPRKHTQCTICNRNFSTLTAYTKHHQVEHGDLPLPVMSARSPGSTSSTTLHGQGRYICEICGALLAANSIYSHVNTHTRERQYTCATCGMQFNAKGTLQRHYLTHTGEKPVECSLCDKRFTQVASMKLHYRTIHLKEPYPKRTRKRKTEPLEETSLIAEHYQNKEAASEMSLSKWRTLRW